MALIYALYAFYTEHRRCGDRVEEDRVWMTCSRGAALVRVVPFS